MSIQIIQDRVSRFSPQSKQEEEHALKEIYQEIALSALSRSGFFKTAAFQGGTCLRIIHGLNRFSEDLDFILTHPNKEFVWEPFLKNMQQEFAIYGVELEAEDRTKAPGPIQRAFLKQDSFGKILQLAYERNASDRQQITIRLEVDTHPPSGSIYTNHHLGDPGHNKPMAAKTSHGSLTINAVPRQRYTLPGWFIKDWNGRRLVHYQGIHRAPYWFQPIHLASTELVKAMESYAKASL